MANYLMLLSGRSEFEAAYSNNSSPNGRVFECKTCNRQFPSFQALGGHRASHKKPRLMGGDGEPDGQSLHNSPANPKTHECSICGLEFAIGQALGGHMRRHRAAVAAALNGREQASTATTSSSSGSSLDSSKAKEKDKSKRALFLDLNLTPFENDLEILKLGKAAPLVDCFY